MCISKETQNDARPNKDQHTALLRGAYKAPGLCDRILIISPFPRYAPVGRTHNDDVHITLGRTSCNRSLSMGCENLCLAKEEEGASPSRPAVLSYHR